ncbi:MAG: hypothetical protein ACREMZ_01350 [Gemmatimonadales bacterium]
MDSDLLGLAAVLALVCFVAGVVSVSRLPPALKLLVYAGLLLRGVGAVLRYEVLLRFYGGVGDAKAYYREGLVYAEYFSKLDFSPFFDPTLWHAKVWWGTQFMYFPSGIVLSLIGPTMLGAFVVFSLFAFLGLVGFAVAFRRSYPSVPVSRYVRWIWLFPSLWYWPSSVGKESITMMGLGLAVAGFIGRGSRMNWGLLSVGLLLVFAIRPQVAAVVLLSMIVAQWLSFRTPWTVGRVVQGVLILGLGLAGIWYSMRTIGVGGYDVEGVQSYIADDPARRLGGGSGIEAVTIDWNGVALAMVNTLLRPFPFEATNGPMIVASLEICAFWVIAWVRRRRLIASLRYWRSDRFLRLALTFVLIYSVALGMMLTNLGIIARQRIFLFPFLFLLLEAAPKPRRQVRRTREPWTPLGQEAPLAGAGEIR